MKNIKVAPAGGIEPPPAVLETATLPLSYAGKLILKVYQKKLRLTKTKDIVAIKK